MKLGVWTKSARCDTSTCVEARLTADGVEVRNSTDPGLVVYFSVDEWLVFLAGAATGQFDIE